jgi:hypothetical protein
MATSKKSHVYKARILTGKAKAKAADFEPAAPLPTAPGISYEEINQPRPGTSRYPISRELFQQLKHSSVKGKKLAKRGCTVTQDKPQNRVEIASAAPGAGGPTAFAPFSITAPTPAAWPNPSTNFAGIPATTWLPPDCTLAVGPEHVLASVNSSIAIYRKTGGPAVIQRTLTVWFSSVVQGLTIFDPKALYDQHSNRWVLLAVAVASNPNRSLFLLSVSKTADPLGGWFNYALDAMKDGTTVTKNWVDYPSLGVDAHALYLTGNMFKFNGPFQYAKIRIVPKTGPYSGGAVTFKDIVKLKNADGSMAFTIQPCHTFGAPQVQYLINSYFPSDENPESKLSLWSLTNTLANPSMTLKTIDTTPYALPPDSIQKGGGTPLDTGDVRILNAVFRGGSVWCSLTTRENWGEVDNVSAIHWFQIEAATPSLVQQAIYGGKKAFYSYPAVMPDNNGNMIMVFSRCGSTEFGSVFFTGRQASDPLGTLRPSLKLIAGTANYLGLDKSGRNRWETTLESQATPPILDWSGFYSLFAQKKPPSGMWATWIGSAF